MHQLYDLKDFFFFSISSCFHRTIVRLVMSPYQVLDGLWLNELTSFLEPPLQVKEKWLKSYLYQSILKPVEIFVRPPLPIRKAGGEWYQYRELMEKEMDTRLKWYFRI